MKTILIAIILLSTNNLDAQILDLTITQRLNLDYVKRRNDCFDQEGQQNINYCLSLIITDLDRIMKSKLVCILKYFNNEIENYSISKEDTEFVTDLKNQKQSFLISQEYWQKMYDANSNFWENGGGTISSQYVAESLIKDLIDRILFLEMIIAEKSQGYKGIRCDEK